MNDLFRFLVLRPPTMEAPPEAAPVATDSTFQEDLNTALDAEKPRAAVEAVAQAKMAEPDFVSDPQSLEFGPRALDFLDKVGNLPAKASLESARALVRATFKTTPEALAGNETFQKEKSSVSDSLVAIHVAGAEEQATARSLGALVRAFRLIERIAAGDATLSKAGALEQAANAPLVLPRESSRCLPFLPMPRSTVARPRWKRGPTLRATTRRVPNNASAGGASAD